jgi:subtilisin family serine protease
MEEYGGHGTAVASIIAGTSEDLPGIAPGSSLLSLRVLPPEGTGDTFTLAEGIVEAVNQGAHIVNLSLGTYGDCFILRDAVDYALESGVAVVAAAGNDAVEGLVYPAKYEGVLAVSGVDAGAKHLYFANRGPDVDIAAPGIGINTAVPGDSVGQFSGTSAAVPFVSGSLAWLMSEDPGMSASDAAEILCRYSNDVDAPGKDDKTGYGVLDIGRVQDRNKRGIYDVALENPYIHPPAPEDEAVRVVMFAQNRGTEYLDSVELEVEIDQELYKRTFYNVAVGDTMSHEFLLGKEKISQSGNVRIRSSVTIEGDKDTDPGNNSGAWVVVPQNN